MRVGSAKLYCNTTGNGMWPYDTPATATNDVCEILASAALVAGVQTEIEVDAGEYPITSEYATLDNVKLIAKAGAMRPSFYPNHSSGKNAGAFSVVNGGVLDGFAFTNWLGTTRSCVTVGAGSTIRRCVFRDNSSTVNGGALTLEGEYARGEDLEIIGNQTRENGGGVCMAKSTLLLNSTVNDNWTTGVKSGGGIYVKGMYAVLSNCVVCANRTGTGQSTAGNTKGGGIYTAQNNIFIYDTKICNNFSYGRGGGVSLAGNRTILVNCLIAKNGALLVETGGQGFDNYNSDHSPLLYNCTITANGVDPDGQTMSTGIGAVLGKAKVVNSIIAGNYGTQATTGAATEIRNSCVPIDAIEVDAVTGKDARGNIKAEALLKPNHELSNGSPCINAGSDSDMRVNLSWINESYSFFLSSPFTIATDLEATARKKGRAVDMGCYEFLATGFSVIVR